MRGIDVDMRFLRRRHIHLIAAGADGTDERHNVFEVLCFLREGEGFVVLRPLCDNEGFTVMRQRLPDFFRDVRHKRVQEL